MAEPLMVNMQKYGLFVIGPLASTTPSAPLTANLNWKTEGKRKVKE